MSISVAQHTKVLNIIATSRLLNKKIEVSQGLIEVEVTRLNTLLCEYWKEAKVDVDLLDFSVNLIMNNMSDFVNPLLHDKIVRFYVADFVEEIDCDEYNF